tara:strand:- start:75 stop:254 length:180 start_codon:yes stop_codon:yes gene_type:complete
MVYYFNIRIRRHLMVEMEVEVTVEMVVGEMEEMGTETVEMVVMVMETVVLEEQKMLVLV